MSTLNAAPSSQQTPPAQGSATPVRWRPHELEDAIRPVDDLDGFVNTRWRAAHPIPADRSCWDCFTILAEHALDTCATIARDAATADTRSGTAERVVGDFWRSAMQGDGMQRPAAVALADEFATIDALRTPAGIADYLHETHARGTGLLYRFEVVADADDPSRYGARIGQGGLGLPDPADYRDDAKHDRQRRESYRTYIARMLAHGGLPADRSDTLAACVLAMETRLATASLTRQALRDDMRLHHRRVSLAQARQAYPTLQWDRLFEALGVVPPRHVSLPMPAFHRAMQELLHTAPVEHWHAYLRFHTLNRDAPWLDDESAGLHHRFHGRQRDGRTPPARWKRVLQAIDVHAGEAMGACFVRQALPDGAREAVARLVGHLRTALHRRIARADWISTPTRAQALHKLARLQVKIGGPWHPPSWDECFTTPGDWHANLAAARAYGQRCRTARLGQTVDPDDWSLLPQTVNARYEPQANAVVVPAALLQPPFFDPQADDASNFGGIGAVIAHEMTHAFDDQGSRFDAAGRLTDGWPSADRHRFEARARRLVALIGAFEAGDGPVDGQRTLGENIADFGGLATACDAFVQASGIAAGLHEGDIRLQRFFLGWATLWRQNLSAGERAYRRRLDPHAPAAVRVNAAAADLPAFAQAFGCRPGDRLWRAPEQRAGIW